MYTNMVLGLAAFVGDSDGDAAPVAPSTLSPKVKIVKLSILHAGFSRKQNELI
jgi:hypothetical protein